MLNFRVMYAISKHEDRACTSFFLISYPRFSPVVLTKVCIFPSQMCDFSPHTFVYRRLQSCLEDFLHLLASILTLLNRAAS